MTEVIEEYAHDSRIVHEDENGYKQYHYEGPLGRVKSFESESKARLYADVQTVMGGFREEKTGERGVPPSVARGRDAILMAYLAAQPTMSMQYVARQFDLSENEVRQYIEIIRNQAAGERGDLR